MTRTFPENNNEMAVEDRPARADPLCDPCNIDRARNNISNFVQTCQHDRTTIVYLGSRTRVIFDLVLSGETARLQHARII